MRIALFSDIHGNPHACEAVLQATADDDPFDDVVAAGDLCLGGSDPARCVDLLREAGVSAVYGNIDEYVYAPDQKPGDELHLRKWDRLLETVNWVRIRFEAGRINWLRDLPFDIHISPTTNPNDSLLVVHANPKNIEDMIYPPPHEQKSRLGEIIQPDDDPALDHLMEGVTAKTIAFGHLHLRANDVGAAIHW